MTYQVKDAVDNVLCEGDLASCWHYLVMEYGDVTVANLHATGIRIEAK